MARRDSSPPSLPGYTFVSAIGEGGFADVYLYEQQMPRRQVAVKVLLGSETEGRGREKFNAEANVMAQLSTHASIVPIYQADVSADGRPYLVMEYCPQPNLAVRYRQAPLAVPEVLETMIRISSAVETAHRAGILHRDIKPHNILTNAYGQPKLTDFGIAHSGGDDDAEGEGMSVPWSPPEMFWDRPPADVRSDVFALAATTYTLLAGRSPFEVPGAANDNHTLMTRIERQPLSRLTRPDVADELNDALAIAMSKSLDDRYPTAMAFARRLQDVEISLKLAPTRIEVLDASPIVQDVPLDDARTRVRPVSIIVPDLPTDNAKTVARPQGPRVVPPSPAVTDETIARPRPVAPLSPGPVELVAPETQRKRDAIVPPPVEPAESSPTGDRSRSGVLIGAGVAVVLAVVAGAVLVLGPGSDGANETPGLDDREARNDAIVVDGPLPPTEVVGRLKGGKAIFTWTNPDEQPGDTYQYAVEGDGGPRQFKKVAKPTVTLTPVDGVPACIVVQTVRGTSGSAATPLTCAGK